MTQLFYYRLLNIANHQIQPLHYHFETYAKPMGRIEAGVGSVV